MNTLQKAKELLETEGYTVTKKEVELKTIGEFEITTPIQVSSYTEAEQKCPKGFRLPEIWELVKLYLATDYLKEYEKGNWRWFLSSTKEGTGVRRLNRDRDGDWLAGWSDDFDGFGEDCRVCYVREKK